MKSLTPAYRFTDAQKGELQALLGSVAVSPYDDYAAFRDRVRALVDAGRVPRYFHEVCDRARERDLTRRPLLYLQNCPNDTERPLFGFTDPVAVKRRNKRTFVAEALLELFATLVGTETITYKNDNDGDFFHDVLPMEALQHSQSQKSLVSLGFHNDSANHFARPRCINLLCMRNPDANAVMNTFVANDEAIARLDAETIEILRRPQFFTPYDDLTKYGDGEARLDDPDLHPVLQDEARLVFFENRTTAAGEEGRDALAKLRAALHEVKYSQRLEPDDFVCVENNLALHGREVVSIRDPEAHKTRWLVKSYSVDSLRPYEKYFVDGRYGVVNG